jgi:nucleotide-binding universal stress UspA family protein
MPPRRLPPPVRGPKLPAFPASPISREIIRKADEIGADLIIMASHGRSGVGALVIGSVASKVLTHSTIPVLIYRR